MKAPRPRVLVRPYRAADRTFVERGLDSQLREKARRAPMSDIVPWRGFGVALAAHLRKEVRQRRGIFLIAEMDGARVGLGVGAPFTDPAWLRRGWPYSRPFYIEQTYATPASRRFGVERILVTALESHFAAKGFDFVLTAHHAGYSVQSRVFHAMGFGPIACVVGRSLAPVRSRPEPRKRGSRRGTGPHGH